jgi:hypothetical protein
VNHTRFPKEDHLPDWARRDDKVKKGGQLNTDDTRKLYKSKPYKDIY